LGNIKLYILFLIPVLGGNTCKGQAHQSELVNQIIEKTWWHSYEDDDNLSDDILPYREEGYDFPRSRGREGFKMGGGGNFMLYGIAPTDGIRLEKGTWSEDSLRIKVKIEGKNEQEFSLKIVSLEDGILRIKKLP